MRLGPWVLFLLAGCSSAGSAHYDERDNRSVIAQDIETVFYIVLPDTFKGKPTFSPGVLSLGKDEVDEKTHQRMLEFSAKGFGETEIKVGADYSLRVKVGSASDRPGMRVHIR